MDGRRGVADDAGRRRPDGCSASTPGCGSRLPNDRPIDLAAVGRRLASFGVTGVTDCTPTPTADYFDTLAEAVRTGDLPVTVAVTGGPELSDVQPTAPACDADR